MNDTPGGGDPRRTLGADGEAAVANWYARRGFVIVDRNWRVRGGEIDLVLARAAVLVFCEVKTRTSDRFGTGLDAVTPAKQRRLRSLAGEWLRAHPEVRAASVRFDVAALLVTSERTELRVVEHAF